MRSTSIWLKIETFKGFDHSENHDWPTVDHHGVPAWVQGCRDGPWLRRRKLWATSSHTMNAQGSHVVAFGWLRAHRRHRFWCLSKGCLRLRARSDADVFRPHRIECLQVSATFLCCCLHHTSRCSESLVRGRHPTWLHHTRSGLGPRPRYGHAASAIVRTIAWAWILGGADISLGAPHGCELAADGLQGAAVSNWTRMPVKRHRSLHDVFLRQGMKTSHFKPKG